MAVQVYKQIIRQHDPPGPRRRLDDGTLAALELGLIVCAALAVHAYVKILDWVFEKIPWLWWPVYAIIGMYSVFMVLILGGFI